MSCRYQQTTHEPEHMGYRLGGGWFMDEDAGLVQVCVHQDPEGLTPALASRTFARHELVTPLAATAPRPPVAHQDEPAEAPEPTPRKRGRGR